MRLPLVIAALALTLLVPAQAGAAATIGTDLSRVPDDAMADCTRHPVYGVPTYATSCTWYSTISNAENHIIPEGVGVVTRARVRVGRTTGLMQFVDEAGQDHAVQGGPAAAAHAREGSGVGQQHRRHRGRAARDQREAHAEALTGAPGSSLRRP